ncbi:hypothetical protein [Thalassotalea profundi]|uniref:Uncharacterized protein n=1 Tax=Thalassotalea profundi TaxID=2036687 RepID=A0ABQ3IQ29_9GAMM|nr:hypothetical protein [Thalassotalea profundi]GHE87459.1 hypothetical protein GCM10011501_16170 [Thalassotalea profundi]
MIPGLGALSKLSNSGQMPISGGDAKSGNGDSVFSADAQFGGINYNAGMNVYLVAVVAAVSVVGIFVYVQSKAK